SAVCLFGVEQRRLIGHGERLSLVANLQSHVNPTGAIDIENDVGSLKGSEARHRCGQRITTRVQEEETVLSGLVRSRGEPHSRLLVLQGKGCPRNLGTRTVGDRATQAGANFLRAGRERRVKPQKENESNTRRNGSSLHGDKVS